MQIKLFLLISILSSKIITIHPSELALIQKLKKNNIEIIYDKPKSHKEKTDQILKHFKNHNLLSKKNSLKNNFSDFPSSLKTSFLFVKDYYFITDDKLIKSNYFKTKMECVFDHFKIIMIRAMVLVRQLSQFDFSAFWRESDKIQLLFNEIAQC